MKVLFFNQSLLRIYFLFLNTEKYYVVLLITTHNILFSYRNKKRHYADPQSYLELYRITRKKTNKKKKKKKKILGW